MAVCYNKLWKILIDKTIQICEAQKGLGIIRLRQSCLVEQSPM